MKKEATANGLLTGRVLSVKRRIPKRRGSGIRRFFKYSYLRFTRLRGDPRELALGMAFGVFAGSMPIMPFQIALAVLLSIPFRASKIAAALGTWISNPLNWYPLYYYSYKIGASILGLPTTSHLFSSIMNSVNNHDGGMIIAQKIAGAGGMVIVAFLIGGLVLGAITGPASYFIFLKVFRSLEQWRNQRGVRN